MHKFLSEPVFSVLWDIFLGMELLGRVLTLCLAFEGYAASRFPKNLHGYTFLPALYSVLVFPHPC